MLHNMKHVSLQLSRFMGEMRDREKKRERILNADWIILHYSSAGLVSAESFYLLKAEQSNLLEFVPTMPCWNNTMELTS